MAHLFRHLKDVSCLPSIGGQQTADLIGCWVGGHCIDTTGGMDSVVEPSDLIDTVGGDKDSTGPRLSTDGRHSRNGLSGEEKRLGDIWMGSNGVCLINDPRLKYP